MPLDRARPLLCLVTDRRRLLAATGRPVSDWASVLGAQIEGACRGGVDLIQIREPDLDTAALANVVRRAIASAQGTPTRIVVNERLDVAVATGSHGVHLKEDSFLPRIARRLAAGRLVGRSVHSVGAARASDDADYVIAGSVFETVSKPKTSMPLGIDGLRSIAQAVSCPVLAIGGVTVLNLPALAGTGAAGIAAIGAFVPSGGSRDLVATVQELTSELRFAFDSRGSVS